MNYISVVISRQGPPSVLQITENPLREPDSGEVRVKILYTGVGYTDVIMRYGYYPYAPKIPFAPGYEIVGIIDALGAGVTGFTVGQKVAALTVHGGYAEYIYVKPADLVAVPDGLDDIEVVGLILNYVTAYQMLHRAAKVQKGQTIYISGASGGVGNALLQLGQLEDLKMYGLASKKKHDLVTKLGGIPIDYRSGDIYQAIHSKEPGGIDAAFDSVGPATAYTGYKLLKRGGILVCIGMTSSIQNGKFDMMAGMLGFMLPNLLNVLPDGKKSTFFGITQLYRENPRPFHEDLPKLFQLLGEKKIEPVIGGIFPLREAAKVNEMVEKGEAQGKLILKCTSD